MGVLIGREAHRFYMVFVFPVMLLIVSAGLIHNAYSTAEQGEVTLHPLSALGYIALVAGAMTRRRDRTLHRVATGAHVFMIAVALERIVESLAPGWPQIITDGQVGALWGSVHWNGQFTIETALILLLLHATLLTERVSLRTAALMTAVAFTAASFLIAHYATTYLVRTHEVSVFSIGALFVATLALFVRYRSVCPIKALHRRQTAKVLWPLVLVSQVLPWLAAFNLSFRIEPTAENLLQVELAFGLVSAAMMAILFWVGFLMAKHQDDMDQLAYFDPLTGASNRTGFARTVAGKTRASLILLDLDQFKAVNDHHGHAVGDEVLHRVGSALIMACRLGETVTRWGGEEFLISGPEMKNLALAQASERFRLAVEAIDFSDLDCEGREPIRMTTSIGFGGYDAQQETIDEALKTIDAALYVAKHSGRNRCVGADGPLGVPVRSIADQKKCAACIDRARNSEETTLVCTPSCNALAREIYEVRSDSEDKRPADRKQA